MDNSEMNLSDIISCNIRYFCKIRNKKISELEKGCGLAVGYISRLSRFKGGTSIATMIKIAKFLDVSLDTLVNTDYSELDSFLQEKEDFLSSKDKFFLERCTDILHKLYDGNLELIRSCLSEIEYDLIFGHYSFLEETLSYFLDCIYDDYYYEDPNKLDAYVQKVKDLEKYVEERFSTVRERRCDDNIFSLTLKGYERDVLEEGLCKLVKDAEVSRLDGDSEFFTAQTGKMSTYATILGKLVHPRKEGK